VPSVRINPDSAAAPQLFYGAGENFQAVPYGVELTVDNTTQFQVENTTYVWQLGAWQPAIYLWHQGANLTFTEAGHLVPAVLYRSQQ
jgi:competence CoiA-like predicted nuclease